MPTKPRPKTRLLLLVELDVDLETYGTEDVADIVDGAIQNVVHWTKKITVLSPRDAEERR